jgi:PAS domain S-box-containing protein
MANEQAGEHETSGHPRRSRVTSVGQRPDADAPLLWPPIASRADAAAPFFDQTTANLTGAATTDPDEASRAMMRGSLDALIRLIERNAPGMRGSVLLLDLDGVTLHHGAAPHLPDAYCQAIDGASIGPAAGSCGTAAWRRERVIVRDIATDSLWADYKQLGAAYGLAACWSTPILDTGGRVLGTFAMYYDEPREPTAAELELADTGARLAGNAIKRDAAERLLRSRMRVVEQSVEILRESEARFRAMAETIPVHVWTAKPDGQLDFMTEKVARYFGQPVHALLGAGWTQVIHPGDLERVGGRWTHSLQTGEPYDIEFRIFSAETGEYRWHLVRAHPMRNVDGEIVQWFGSNTDIEEQKRLEAARDAALADAKRANQAKADFLAMMSHELRTPLNAIGGYAQLMMEGIPTPPSEAQINQLRRISKSQQHLLGLIEAVLTHAKVEAGKVTYRITDVPVRDILDIIEPLTAPQRAAKRLRYDCDGCDAELVVRADREKVVQIMLNLLSNAAKFTPMDGKLTVTTETRDAGFVAFSVRDTGIGMSREQLEIVFEPYVQFDSSLSREHRGTGLGMPISRELARGMGGDLVAESEQGIGSVFTLTLPTAAPG